MMGKESAAECKEHAEKQIASLQAEADALSGKDHQKARGEKGKKISALRSGGRYIDACRVTKGLAPAHGHFEAESADTAGAEAEGSQATQRWALRGKGGMEGAPRASTGVPRDTDLGPCAGGGIGVRPSVLRLSHCQVVP